MEDIKINILYKWLTGFGLNEGIARGLNVLLLSLIIVILAYFSDLITRRFIITIIAKIIKRSKTIWDDLFLEKKVFNRLSHFAPAIVIYLLIQFFFPENPKIVAFVQSGVKIYIIVISLLFFNSLINALNSIYLSLDISKNRPITGYLQIIRIFLYFSAGILIISVIFKRDPFSILAGLGALAAILILVFRDTILGFTASIQLSANDMVKPGDWIEMPQYNADGTVIEMALNTVKVQNWDKTITTIPTYALVSNSFYNWKGMEKSGGRRIKRSINIDMKSIKFVDPPLREKLKRIQLIRDYVEQREKEIMEYNKNLSVDESSPVNGRRMTNIGIFRRYIEAYLSKHPKIHTNMTFMVRHLQPTEKGLPLQVYVFSKEQQWVNYEALQADIFDHILSAVSEFDLRVFQNPSGDDFKKLVN